MEKVAIPIAPEFFVDKDGNVYDSDGKIRTTYRNGDGYVTVAIKFPDGHWTTMGVHRLVALAFLFRRPPECTQVNHRDGDLSNNAVTNLEWVTPSQNNIHSEITRRDNQYPTITIGFIGKPHYTAANNVWDASRLTGIPPLDIWDAIRDNKPVYPFEFRHRPFDGKIPLAMHKPRLVNRDASGNLLLRPVKLFDIDTGEVTTFDSIGAAAKQHSTSPSHVYQSITRKGNIRFLQKRYLVAYLEDDFPEVTPEQFEQARNHGARDVIAYNVATDHWVLYSSAKEFITDSKLSKKAVTTVLAKDELRLIDSWVVLYLREDSAERIKAYVAGPASA